MCPRSIRVWSQWNVRKLTNISRLFGNLYILHRSQRKLFVVSNKSIINLLKFHLFRQLAFSAFQRVLRFGPIYTTQTSPMTIINIYFSTWRLSQIMYEWKVKVGITILQSFLTRPLYSIAPPTWQILTCDWMNSTGK